jgi:uncharacterized membrane protein
MLRQHVTSTKTKYSDRIEWRNHEVLRIEAFTDAVFAFAITLLIVSLEVPKSYHELIENLKGFVPFAICFAFIFQVWYTQNIFFRRFGLHDTWTVVLNGVLIFTVLFFVYPLKFMYFAFTTASTNINSLEEFRNVLLIYDGGYTLIYLIFAVMYWHAARNKREHIGLKDSEAFEAKTDIYQNLIMAGSGIVSALMVLSGGLALIFFWLPFPFLGVFISILHSRRATIRKRKFVAVHDDTTEV